MPRASRHVRSCAERVDASPQPGGHGTPAPARLATASARRQQLNGAFGAFAGDDSPQWDASTGPLAGQLLAVKDNLHVAGMPCRYGSAATDPARAEQDSYVVARARAAGAVIVGRTSMPELGTLPFTESRLVSCRNPHDHERTAGGSSGGAAVAVATGMADLSIATDGGGSTRIPAACCGVVGLKTSRGLVSWGPTNDEFAGGLATIGLMGRAAADVRLLLDIVAGPEVGDPYSAVPASTGKGPLLIGVQQVAPDGRAVADRWTWAVEHVSTVLRAEGHVVTEFGAAAPVWTVPGLPDDLDVLMSGIAGHHSGLDPADLEPRNRQIFERAERTTTCQYVAARIRLGRAARHLLASWGGLDVLLTPALADDPPRAADVAHDQDPVEVRALAGRFTPFTRLANVTGQPAVVVPVTTSDRLPVAVQLIGRPGTDRTLLDLCALIEADHHQVSVPG